MSQPAAPSVPPGPFDPFVIKSLALPNRFVRSATWEGLATDAGNVTPGLCERMAELARGDVGLIISGHAYVRRDGQAGFRQLGVHDPAQEEGLAAMARAAHAAGGHMALQLAHAGMQAGTARTGLPAVDPGDLSAEGLPPCQALTAGGIADLVEAFARAALLAKNAGFDAVQIHAAHGYLLSQFLSPAWNRRTDVYGGALANRARMAVETARAVRAAVGPDYPVLAKLNAEDFVSGGQTPADAVEAARLLAQAGVDAIEISGGCRQGGETRMPARRGRIKNREAEVYYREAARLYKKRRVPAPLILVGGIRSIETAEELLASSEADLIALSRPLICEPDLVHRWRNGDRRPALCVSDNACYGPANAGEGVSCVTFAKRLATTRMS